MRILATNAIQPKEKKREKKHEKRKNSAQYFCVFCVVVRLYGSNGLHSLCFIHLSRRLLQVIRINVHSIYTVLARTISISVPYFTLHYIYFTFWSSGVSIPVSHKLILDWISTYNTEYVGRICFRQIYELPVWIDQNKNDKNLGHNSYCTSTGGSASNLSSIHEFILHKFVAREREAF